MAKVGFNPLALGAEAVGMATCSEEKDGAATGAGSGWAEDSGEAAGADSSIRFFFLDPPLKG